MAKGTRERRKKRVKLGTLVELVKKKPFSTRHYECDQE
jgi:hypothetical protein